MIAERKAWFCLNYQIDPSEYEALTREEREAFKQQGERMAQEIRDRMT